MRTRLSIGEFSAAAHLSVRTLRRYHENGLLPPAEIDERTGYRYYAPAQIGTAQSIRRLRELDLPVREIAELLNDPDDRRRRDVLDGHLRRLEDRLTRTADAVSALRRLLDPEPGEFAVERRVVDPLTVASITEVLDHSAVLDWYAGAMTELGDVLADAGRPPEGPPGALIDDAIFAEERGRITVFVPVPDPPARGRVVPLVVPGGELAVAVHVGSHADIDVTYGQLATWVLDRGLDLGGPVRESYLVGPRDTPNADDWRTEISWTVAGSRPSTPAGRRGSWRAHRPRRG